MVNATFFQRRSVHGMFIFVLFAVGTTALVLLVLINTLSAIADLQDSPSYKTRQALLREGSDEGTVGSSSIMLDGKNIDISNWKTYRNEKYRFEIKYPAMWFADVKLNSRYFRFSQTDKIVHGTGDPLNGAWVNIEANPERCLDTDNKFESPGDPPSPYLFKGVCRGNLQIYLNIWKDNFQDKASLKELEEILYTINIF